MPYEIGHNVKAGSVRWTGLAELRAALRALPEELAGEAERIVVGTAEAAYREIDARYASQLAASLSSGKWPNMKHTGNLRAGLDIDRTAASRFGVGVVLVNRAPHAWWYEHGTQARASSTHRNLGRVPARPTFIPTVIKHRNWMYGRLADLLAARGLMVKVTADRAA